jgi:L-fuconolactonase
MKGVNTADQGDQAALEPEIVIVDAHHHLWPVPPSPLLPVYGPANVAEDIWASGHNVIATVYVDSHANHAEDGPVHLRPAGETRYAESVAEAYVRRDTARLCSAIVASADLTRAQEVGELLDAHLAASPRFRGIRHGTAWDADAAVSGSRPDVMASAAFRAGFAELGRRGLSFDAWLFHTQLDELFALAAAFPETTIVLDHIGTPLGIGRFQGRRDEVFQNWRAGLARLAKAPNVVVKIGGLNMDFGATGAQKLPEPRNLAAIVEWQRDYVLTAIDLFAPDRCMFESNFPVDRSAVSYRTIWNVFKRLTEVFSDGERAQLFSGTASRVYRIDLG